jgi:uncharacterized protein (DUF433 family)
MESRELLNRIIVDPKIMVGKPIIKGTRLTVERILGLLAQGMTTDDLLAEYNKLTKEDVLACLAFAQKAVESSSFVPLTA